MNRSVSLFKGWKLVFLLYLGALALNFGYLKFGMPGYSSGIVTANSIEVNLTDQVLEVPYSDEYSGEQKNPETILFLNLSRKEGDDLPEIKQELARKFRVISPDFITLSKNYSLDSYSFHTQAEVTGKLLEALEIDSVHVAGYKYGALAGIHLYNDTDITIRSVAMISSYGVQELEFLGGYHLNHGVYTAHLLFLELLKYGVPHFGGINVEDEIAFLKIINSSDQRMARKLFQNLEVPVLVQHCESDKEVSVDIAREHDRIIPQSTLSEYQCENILQAESLSDDLITFINTSGTTGLSVTSLDVARSLVPFRGKESYRIQGFSLLIVMLLIIVATFVSEDLTCIGAGLMVARGLIGFWPAVIACLLGIFVGDILVYLLGKWLGASIVKKAPVRWFISERDLERTNHWFEAKGPAIIIMSRFIPGSRFPTYVSAGILEASFLMFILYFGIASILWTPLLVGAAVLAGQELIYYFTLYQDYAIWVLVGVVVLLMAVFKLFIPLLTYRGRRLLLGKWRRIRNWEFWPAWAIYPPVCVYVAYLWIRYGKLTMCTAANPAIPEGGFVGESKAGILSKIGAQEYVAKYLAISGTDDISEKQRKAEVFLKENDLDFPVVIKPDEGERGRGVRFPKSSADLEEAVSEMQGDFIIQEYISGREYGVFYYRYPDSEKGEVFSITKKELMYLTGDGKHTLEELILRDERAVCLAEMHFEEHWDDLYEIPGKGKKIKLVELGTHARGALFYDAGDLITSGLTNKIEGISRSFEGFYFGRYDLKVPSEEDLKAGENIKIVELNALTAESTNMYDPEKSYFDALKILMKQWKISYEIGYQNYKRGAELPSLSHMARIIFERLSN